jgi:hypothetical protein
MATMLGILSNRLREPGFPMTARAERRTADASGRSSPTRQSRSSTKSLSAPALAEQMGKRPPFPFDGAVFNRAFPDSCAMANLLFSCSSIYISVP